MDGIRAFITHREVGPYKNDIAIRFALLVPWVVLGLALSNTISTVFCIVVAIVLLIIYTIVYKRQRKDELYLNDALQGTSLMMVFIIMGNSVAHMMNMKLWFYLICVSCFVIVVVITIMRICRRISKCQYGRNASNDHTDDIRIAVGGFAGVLGYFAANMFAEKVNASILIALMIMATYLFLIKVTESVMLHYYVKKYRLGSLIRVMHIQ